MHVLGRRRGRRGPGIAGVVGMVWLAALALPAGAAARETRTVLDGRYDLSVGFLTEPAFEGEPNGLYLRIGEEPSPGEVVVPMLDQTPEAEVPEPTPVPGSELAAEVLFGPTVRPLVLEPAGPPGVFRAFFVPTQPGDYVFRIAGILDGAEIIEEFRTGPGGIPPVVAVPAVQFPDEVPVNQGLLDALAKRETETERARTLAAVGIALGVVGLLAGGVAVVLSRRPPPGGLASAPSVADAREERAADERAADERAAADAGPPTPTV